MFSRNLLLVVIAGSTLLPGSLAAIAEDAQLFLHIRTLEASKNITLEKVSKKRGARFEIDGRASDLTPKLKQLHYRRFRLTSSTKKVVPIAKIETINLGGGHVLKVKPLSKKKDRVCLWIEWKDGKGMQVIDTQMHMNVGESMVTGMDKSEDGGVILAIDVQNRHQE